jgi:2-methylisocitrate lyase-like PEP mutase family enzyme
VDAGRRDNSPRGQAFVDRHHQRGYAFSLGRQDNTVGRAGILQNAADIVAATDLPVSADLENGFGHSANAAAETIRQAAAIGLVGGSIEDSTYDKTDPLYGSSTPRTAIRAAVETARAQPFPFVLTARAENFLVGRPNLADAIKRLQAYQDAGADVLYAPASRAKRIFERWCSRSTGR